MRTSTPPDPRRADRWQLRTSELVATRGLPWIMGIVNVTPDSFSDGGQLRDAREAVDFALRLADDGADILDIGGESTRPDAMPVTTEEELRRVVPVIADLVRQTRVPISVDTSKSVVAEAALDAGAQVVNDVTGLQGDPRMVDVAIRLQPGLCVMHMQGTPQTMQQNPRYDNVVLEVHGYLRERRDTLVRAGISRERICLDPGIGFGKTHQHNLDLLAHAEQLHELRCPILIGHSRKGFIARVLGNQQRDRLAGNIGVAIAMACRGIQALRVHDVRAVKDACQLFATVGGCVGDTR